MSTLILEKLNVKKLYIADKTVNATLQMGQELSNRLEEMFDERYKIDYYDVAAIKLACLEYKREVEKGVFLLQGLNSDILVEFQMAKLKILYKKSSESKELLKRLLFLMSLLEKHTVRQRLTDQEVQLGKKEWSELISEFKEYCDEIKAEEESTTLCDQIVKLHCSNCHEIMAHLIFINGTSIAEIEHTALQLIDEIKGFNSETWIIAGPLEFDTIADGSKKTISYVMKIWPDRQPPEKMLSVVFSHGVLKKIEEKHCSQ